MERARSGAVHQVAEDQPVSEWDDEVGAEEECQVFELSQRPRDVITAGEIVPHADNAEDEDDPDRNEDGLDDSRRDVADRECFVLSSRDRIESDGGSDIRDDEQELQEGSQVDLAVLAVAAM